MRDNSAAVSLNLFVQSHHGIRRTVRAKNLVRAEGGVKSRCKFSCNFGKAGAPAGRGGARARAGPRRENNRIFLGKRRSDNGLSSSADALRGGDKTGSAA